jgi:TrmH family RNA methyltransferase
VITSTSNSRVKWVRSLQAQRALRESEDAFVVEGHRLLEEARAAGAQARLILFTGELDPAENALVDALLAAGGQREAVSEHVLKACSATESPQGILAVISQPALDPEPDQDLILVLDRIADPGNLGTMMRSARAAGVDSLLLLAGSVDIYNPKVVRAAAGAHFHLPAREIPPEDLLGALGGVPLWIADAQRGQEYYCVDWTKPAALAIGSESHGHTSRLETLAADFIRIPMRPGTESLNAGVAAAVILFEIARQRGTPCKSEQ